MTEVVAVEAADCVRAAEFLSSFPGDVRPIEFWTRRMRAWWDDNPAFDETCTRAWLLLADEGEVVGFIGNVPTLFQVNRVELRAFGGTTFRVLPEYRSASVRLYIEQVARQPSSWLFNTSANAQAERVLAYLRFRSLPSYRSSRRFLLALDPSSAARAYVNGRVTALRDAVAGVPLGLAQLPLRYHLRRSRREVRVLNCADGAFDALWARTRTTYRHTSIRTAASVEWMCFANRSAPKVLVGCYEGGALRGYAIFAEARWRGLRVLDLVDLWTEAPREESVCALLAGVMSHARERDYAVVALYAFEPRDADIFRRLGVVFWADQDARHYYRPPEPEDVTLELHDSYLTGLEGDRFL